MGRRHMCTGVVPRWHFTLLLLLTCATVHPVQYRCTGVGTGDWWTQEQGRKAQVFAWAGTLPSTHWIPKEHCVDTWASVGLG